MIEMKFVYMYGYSDDLVEIEGDIRDEMGEGFYSFNDGTVIEARYSPDDSCCWRLEVVKIGHGKVEKVQSGDEERTRKNSYRDASPYSDVITIEGENLSFEYSRLLND